MPDKRKRSSSSVERAFELLDVVAGTGISGATLSDLARATGMAVSTCHRYVTALLDVGALRKDPSGQFFIGLKLVMLIGASLETNTLRTLARSQLEHLALVSGETVHLGQICDQGVVYVDKIDSDQTVRLVSRIGSVAPLYCTAMGKAMLAVMSPDERAPHLAVATEVRTPHTLTGIALDKELELVARRRWAIDEQENEDGVRCIGAAITSEQGELLGALSVSGPASRFTREMCADLAPTILKATDSIAHQASWPHIIDNL